MIALDLSRLLSRAGRGTPTGIDRVELAYAQHLIAAGTSTCFAATTVFGGLGLLARPHAPALFGPDRPGRRRPRRAGPHQPHRALAPPRRPGPPAPGGRPPPRRRAPRASRR